MKRAKHLKKLRKVFQIKKLQSNMESHQIPNNEILQEALQPDTNEEEDKYSVSQHSYNLNKKVKTSHYTTDTVGEIKTDEKEKVPMRILFNTGTTSTIILRKFTTTRYTSTFKTKTN